MLHGFQRSFKTFWRKFQAGAFQSVEEKTPRFPEGVSVIIQLEGVLPGMGGGLRSTTRGACQGPPCEVPTQNQKRWRNKNKKSWSIETVKVFQLDQLNVLYLNISLGDGNSNIFDVHPYLGKWSQFDLRICFKWVGEQPPTSDDMTFPTWNSHKNQAWQCR